MQIDTHTWPSFNVSKCISTTDWICAWRIANDPSIDRTFLLFPFSLKNSFDFPRVAMATSLSSFDVKLEKAKACAIYYNLTSAMFIVRSSANENKEDIKCLSLSSWKPLGSHRQVISSCWIEFYEVGRHKRREITRETASKTVGKKRVRE